MSESQVLNWDIHCIELVLNWDIHGIELGHPPSIHIEIVHPRSVQFHHLLTQTLGLKPINGLPIALIDPHALLHDLSLRSSF